MARERSSSNQRSHNQILFSKTVNHTTNPGRKSENTQLATVLQKKNHTDEFSDANRLNTFGYFFSFLAVNLRILILKTLLFIDVSISSTIDYSHINLI